MLTKTLQSGGQILKGMLIVRSYKLICVGRLRCFCGNILAPEIHPHKPLPKTGAQVIAQPLIRHIPAEIICPLGYSDLVLAALKASQYVSGLNFVIPGKYLILLWSLTCQLFGFVHFKVNKFVKEQRLQANISRVKFCTLQLHNQCNYFCKTRRIRPLMGFPVAQAKICS